MALINAGEPKINLRSISDVYEDSKVPIVILDTAFEPVYWNKSGASRFALLIMKNFVKLNLEEDEKQTVRETLREAAFCRLKPKKTTLFDAFIFSTVFDGNGNRLPFYKVQVEETYTSEDFLNETFSGGRLASLLAHELFEPLGLIASVSSLFEQRVGYDEKCRSYINCLNENLYQISRGVHRIADIYSICASYGSFELTMFDPVRVFRRVSSELGTSLQTETPDFSTAVVLDQKAFKKSVYEIYGYLGSLPSSVKSEKTIVTLLREENCFFIAEIRRSGIIRSAFDPDSAFSLRIDDDGNVADSMLFIRRIIEAGGGRMSARCEGRGRSATAIVEIKLPTGLTDSNTLESPEAELDEFESIKYSAYSLYTKKKIAGIL